MTLRDDSAARDAAPAHSPFLKLALEVGPLVTFFVAQRQADLFVATGVFMAAMLVSLGVSYALTRTLPVMPVVSAVLVLVFGGLTLWLQDELFIKLKPTIVNLMFGAALLGGLAFGRPLLPLVLGTVFQLSAEGWRKLTLRWGVFFLLLALLNEVVWRNFTTETWVSFKVFGIMPLTLLFVLSQTPLIMRYDSAASGEGAPPPPGAPPSPR